VPHDGLRGGGGETAVLEAWLGGEPISAILARHGGSGEWFVDSSDASARPAFMTSLQQIASAVRFRIRLAGLYSWLDDEQLRNAIRRGRVSVWLDADWVLASTEEGSAALTVSGPISSATDSPPLFTASLGELADLYVLACDPEPGRDSFTVAGFEINDGVPDNDCMAGLVLGNCPLAPDPTCDPLGAVHLLVERLRQEEMSLSRLELTSREITTTWAADVPGEARAVVDFDVAFDVDFSVAKDTSAYWPLSSTSDINDLAEIRWTEARTHLLLALDAQDSRCAAGFCSTPQPANGSVRWQDFLASGVDATWGSRNLRLAAVDPPAGSRFETTTNFSAGLRDWVYGFLWLIPIPALPLLLSMFDDGFREAEAGADQAVEGVRRVLAGGLAGYLSLLRWQPGETRIAEHPLDGAWDSCDECSVFQFSMDCLRGNCFEALIPDANADCDCSSTPRPGCECGEDEAQEDCALRCCRAQPACEALRADHRAAVERLLLRIMEGAAGANRAWWPAFSSVVDQVNDHVAGEEFAYSGTLGGVDSLTETPTAHFLITSDADCDGIQDYIDRCALTCGPADMTDSDRDGIGDYCDRCRNAQRLDLWATVPQRSTEYNIAPGWDAGSPGDMDGDDIGDQCDLCPYMSAYDEVSDPRPLDEAAIPRDGGASSLSGGTAPHPYDYDRDGIGDRCDNCPVDANRDQWNCNAADERADGRLTDPPTPETKGIGDTCDWMPCVDSCGVASSSGEVQPELKGPREPGDGWLIPPDAEPLQAFVCPVGSVSEADSSLVNLRTKVRGCYCDQAEYRNAVSGTDRGCFDTLCRAGGAGGGRWTDADYDGRAWDYALYPYSRTYRLDRSLGLAGARGGTSGLSEYYRPAGSDASSDRVTEQEWNWISQAEFPAGKKHVKMWFKPDLTPARFGGYGDTAGNTYSPWKWVDPVGIRLASGVSERPPIGGGTSMTLPWEINEDGTFAAISSPLLDLLEVWCYAADCWGWSDSLFFDEPGPRVAGLAVSGWNAYAKNLSWVVGTKIPSGAVFDLKDFAAAFAYDANRDPNRFWTFGGTAPSNRATDQMWAAQLVVLDETGAKTYVGPEGLLVPLSSAPLSDGGAAYFEAGPVRTNGPWPSERSGAALVCAGGTSSSSPPPGQVCDGICPNVDVALGRTEPPDGVAHPAGRLLLIGGEGPEGPLDDIWIYDERATWQPPSAVGLRESGPWPSGWSLVGVLPESSSGLAFAGTVQVGRSLWLVGGRTQTGPTAEVFRVDLDSGQVERIAAGTAGPTPRLAPAVTFDGSRNALVVFGGMDAGGRGLADVWSLDLATRNWNRLASACVGSGCPPATGHETLYVDPVTRDPTVIANRTTATSATLSWTVRGGVWESAAEAPTETADCDGDTTPELLFGARCSTGSGGFPDYGRLRCDDGSLVCRQPAAPGLVLWEQRIPGARAVVRDDADIRVLTGERIEDYGFEADGRATLRGTIRLSRAGHDLAVAPGALLVADGGGLSIYRPSDGALLATVETCGRVRRVFVDGTLAIVVGLRSILTVDVSEPATPAVLERFRLLPLRDRLEVTSCGGCGWLDRSIDRLCDALGACGAFGRSAAAYADHRLFVELLGVLYVLDFRRSGAPEVAGAVPVGLATGLAAEGRFAYVNLLGNRTTVVAQTPEDSWIDAGEHDVPAWVDGVVDARLWAVQLDRGRLQVAGRQ
jgi:hypothetical protein